ncbi:DUF488 family protein [Arthrobacter echini]|nr:DUF488 domain-containing protein [Arthrobacter echini]
MADTEYTLMTVGHGTASQEAFADLLHKAGIRALVDVRIGPGSRKFPHFGKDSLDQWLPAAGIAYRWEKDLGGFRKLLPDSPDIVLRNESFRGYAGYMRSEEFKAALAELLAQARETPTVIMCSETVWWRCHRRLIADSAALLHGITVEHLMPGRKLTVHPPTQGVRVAGEELVYDVQPQPSAG